MIKQEAIRLSFHYAAGDIGSRFLIALRDRGEIVGARCGDCGRVSCPPSSFCSCGKQCAELVPVGPRGTLVSFTEMAGGDVFGLVQLDGADTALVHLLLGESTGWTVGQRVRPRFAEQRRGSIRDLAGFEPLQGATR